ncbi:MAG: alpha/beta fold hydrolase [Acidobacteriaceae bacterium]|nr:alpha/beta fold hydrolase [Acidobacteriaceae bacterium]
MRVSALLCFALLSTRVCAAEKKDWGELRAQLERTLHVPQPLPNPQPKSYGSFSPAPGVDADRVAYSTDYSLRVPAIVYRPSGATITKHPAIVVVNGHGGDKSSWYSYWAGILYARAGAVVLTYDPIGEYERNAERRSATGQHDEYIAPDEMARRMGGLMITDAMQAVTYLLTRKDVDPKRIAVMGYSMGSFISSLVCSVDTRVHACVLVGGGDLDGPGGYWDSSYKKMCQSIPYQSLKFLGDRGALLFALMAKRGPTLVWNGTADKVVDIPNHDQSWFQDLRKRATTELGSSRGVFEFGFTPEGGHRPYFVTKPVAVWLEQQLHFPNWTRKQIDATPERHIMDWAAKNGLTMPSSLKNENGEGGTMALGNDIPAVPRADLHALPEPVWEAERDNFVYETWVDRAKSVISSGAP